MTRSNSNACLSAPIPEDLRALLAKRPIVFGESAKLYDALLARLVTEARPIDTIDWLYIKDVADLTWEIQRLRNVQPAMIRIAMMNDLVESLEFSTSSSEPTAGGPEINYYHLARQYFAGNPTAKRVVAEILPKKDIDSQIESIGVKIIQTKLPALEIIARMAAGLEARRDKVLRGIDRRRQDLGTRMRQVVDAEAEEYTTLNPEGESKLLVSKSAGAS